ncbi:unnamed protein product [Linum trigynum]|uniref:Kinetochore protein Nuf2 N-terminal domain-containing protein n=1 Tax=Linum trigynum TaxID=586398 RepID=A0AAV2EHS6_9ROSI
MSTFNYPVLHRKDIIDLLNKTEIAASKSDLENPTPGFVCRVYHDLLDLFGLFNVEEQGQMEFDDLEQLENPPGHDEEWFRLMNEYNMIREFMLQIDCPHEFTLKDLIKPEPKSTEFFISSILNFCLHRDLKMQSVETIIQETELLSQQRKELEEMKDALDAEIADYNAARERELPFVQELDEKVKELHQTIASLNSQQSSLRTFLRNLKEKTGNMDEEISKSEYDLIRSQEENANLRSMIVQSPDKLQKAIEEKRSIREEARNAERLAMQSFQEKTSVLELYSKTSKKLSKLYSQMQAIHEQMNSAKSTEKDLKARKAKLSDDAVLDKSLAAKIMERRGKAQQLAELRWQLEKERQMKFEDADKVLHSKKLEVESRKHELEERQRKVEAVLGEADAIDSKINLTYETGAAKFRTLDQKIQELVEQFEQYQSSISDAMKGYDGKSTD